jgi:hypothetical protein
MAKIVTITLQNGKELKYSKVARIDEDRYKLNLWGEEGPLLSIDKGEIKTWYAEE